MKTIKTIFLRTGALVLAFCISVSLYAQNGTSALELYNRGQGFQSQGNYYSAIESYREALMKNPSYGDAWYNLALCTYCLGEFDLALEYAQESEKFSRDFSLIKNLEGMSLLSLGRLTEAQDIFNEVLVRFPNDVDSRFGLAEINLYQGSLSSAENRYLDALKRDGRNRKALLSLALVCAEEGKNDVAEVYINQALSYHSGEAEVHYLASYLAAKRGDMTEAERRARSAVQIKGDYDKAYELLSSILFSEKRYAEVIDICDFRIGRDRNNSRAWYLKGISQQRLGRDDQAIATFNTGLSINPEDEVMRLALEQLVNVTYTIEDSRRTAWANYHIEKAREYNRNFEGPAERFEYQTALTVDPLNITARQAFADMLERDCLYELLLYELEFIQQNETVEIDSSIQVNENSPARKLTARQVRNADMVEALQSMLSDTIAKQWNVDPFYLDKTRWNIGIYYTTQSVSLVHADVEQIIAIAAADVFSGISSTSVNVRTDPVSGFGEAYRLARTDGRDYFAIISVNETDRSIQIDCDLYSARTGTKTTDFHIYRTGNNRVSNSLRRLRSSILDILPVRGKVLKNQAGTLLVDLGKSDGVASGASFDVVKKGCVYTTDSGPGIFYRDSDILGTFTVESVNEELCVGKFTKKGFYDTLNLGDEVVLVSLPESSDTSTGNIATDTRPGADADGIAVTNAAEKSESDRIKEDLKAPFKESPLIQMIRDIF